MSRCAAYEPPFRFCWADWIQMVVCLSLLTALAACGSSSQHARLQRSPSRYYPPPGPASNPEQCSPRHPAVLACLKNYWIRRVMRQESGPPGGRYFVGGRDGAHAGDARYV